jgi:disulfide oxidoreductase YuzD
MKEGHKLTTILKNSLDKSKVFVEIHSFEWRRPNKMFLNELLEITNDVKEEYDISNDIDNNTLIIDEKTLKVKINPSFNIAPSVFSEPFINQDIDIHTPPKNTSELSAMHMMVDENYLYVWVVNRWKRTLLSTW